MKVLYCESGSGKGGSANSLLEFLKAARTSEIEPTVLCYAKYARERFETVGVPVVQLDAGRLAQGLVRTRRLILEGGFDLLHANNDIYSHLPTLLLARTCPIPAVVHHRAVRALTRAERFLRRFIAYHVAVSLHVRDNLIAHDIKEQRISVIHNAVALPDRASLDRGFARRDIGLADTTRLAGYIGTLRPEKGLEVLIDAAGRIAEPADLHYVIMGNDYERAHGYRDKLKELVSARGMGDRFHFTGHVADVTRWIGSMDVLVFPTLLPEGFGRATVEGMACGVPVIASNIGAIPEIIEDGITGYLVAPGAVDTLAQKIRQVLTTDSTALVARATRAVADRFSPHVQVAAMLTIYRKLLRF